MAEREKDDELKKNLGAQTAKPGQPIAQPGKGSPAGGQKDQAAEKQVKPLETPEQQVEEGQKDKDDQRRRKAG